MADYIYGELNDAVLNVDYTGSETATAIVSVDASKRGIAADVKRVPNALTVVSQGQTVAYDGSAPATVTVGSYEIREVGSTGNFRNYGLFQSGTEGALGITIGVPSSKNLLSAEVLPCEEDGVPVEGLKAGDFYARFTCASRDGMAQENYFVYMPLNGITEAVGGLVDAERSRAEGAEEALRSSIAEESSARQEADSSLEGKTRHMSAGDSYTDFYETVTFKGNVNVDGTLSNTEISGMSASIASVESSLADEREAREQADSSLGSEIASERSRAMSAENSLSASIGQETADRERDVASLEAGKQATLVSGSNIKTVNGYSLLGEGNLDVSGGLAVDAYTKEQSDARYAKATADVLSSGAVTSIAYSSLSPYRLVVMHGYKNNVSAPNQLTFVLIPSLLNDGQPDLIIPGMAMSTNWNYGVVFTKSGDTVSWETDVDYGGDKQFIVTNILGVY